MTKRNPAATRLFALALALVVIGTLIVGVAGADRNNGLGMLGGLFAGVAVGLGYAAGRMEGENAR